MSKKDESAGKEQEGILPFEERMRLEKMAHEGNIQIRYWCGHILGKNEHHSMLLCYSCPECRSKGKFWPDGGE